jgi:hypothetical protein
MQLLVAVAMSSMAYFNAALAQWKEKKTSPVARCSLLSLPFAMIALSCIFSAVPVALGVHDVPGTFNRFCVRGEQVWGVGQGDEHGEQLQSLGGRDGGAPGGSVGGLPNPGINHLVGQDQNFWFEAGQQVWERGGGRNLEDSSSTPLPL